MNRSAFTLIELLVVMFIIALLLAILLPFLGRSRASAQDVLCIAHLHAVIQADFQYAQDNDGMLAPRGMDPFNPETFAPTNPALWQAHLAPYLGLTSLLQHVDRPQTNSAGDPGPTLHFMDVKLPAGYSSQLVWNRPLAGPVKNFSYGLNQYMGPFKNGAGIPPSPWGYKLSAVPNPAAIIVLGDVAIHESSTILYDEVGPPAPPNSPADPFRTTPGFRHGAPGTAGGHPAGAANFAFADGHAEPLHYQDTLSSAGHWKWW